MNTNGIEIPDGFRPILWQDTRHGQEVWLLGTKDGKPHAYGPHRVSSSGLRRLCNPRRCFTFTHYAEELLVREETR